MISIILPTYNSAGFIVDALSSINNNDYRDVEIIVIDDGSTDSTVDIVAKQPGNIKLFKQKNCGRGAARNNGLSYATGKYIAFLDHDDLLEPTSISERFQYLEDHPDNGWVCTDAMEFDESGDLRLFLTQFSWLDLKEDQFCQLLKGCFPLTSTVMIRSELIQQVGGFNSAIDYGDDIEFFLRLLLVSNIGLIKKPLTRRRIHLTQGVSNTFDRWDSRVRIYSNFKPSCGAMNFKQNAALHQALRFAYFKLGEWYWENRDFKVARKMFLKSFAAAPYIFKAVLYAIMTLAPSSLLSKLRAAKHTVGG